MSKATARASSDIALIKYWGKKDEVLRLPENGSMSIVLKGLDTLTTVEFREDLERDEVMIGGEKNEKEAARVVKHLDRVRSLAGIDDFAKVVSENTFPKGTGLSSSGSGFAALTYAATKAAGLELSEKQLSILARQGSGTACRCACGGFVEWKDGDTSETSYAETVFKTDHWDLRDVVAVVDEGMKLVSSTEGHMSAQSSPFYQQRQQLIGDKIKQVKELINKKDFAALGELVEAESLEFHSILLTSKPSFIAWYPGTVQVMLEVQQLRREGVLAFFTINTGFNVHVLTLPEYEAEVVEKLQRLSLVKKTLSAQVGDKPNYVPNHLF